VFKSWSELNKLFLNPPNDFGRRKWKNGTTVKLFTFMQTRDNKCFIDIYQNENRDNEISIDYIDYPLAIYRDPKHTENIDISNISTFSSPDHNSNAPRISETYRFASATRIILTTEDNTMSLPLLTINTAFSRFKTYTDEVDYINIFNYVMGGLALQHSNSVLMINVSSLIDGPGIYGDMAKRIVERYNRSDFVFRKGPVDVNLYSNGVISYIPYLSSGFNMVVL
jgi:hypothetical protein